MISKVERDSRRVSEMDQYRADNAAKARGEHGQVSVLRADGKPGTGNVLVKNNVPGPAGADTVDSDQAVSALKDFMANAGATPVAAESGKTKVLDSQGRRLGSIGTDFSKLEAMARKLAQSVPTPAPAQEKPPEDGEYGDVLNAGPVILTPEELALEKANRGKTATFIGPESQINENEAIVQYTQRAIDTTAAMNLPPPVTLFQESELICFLVKSKRYNGYVLCAIANEQARLMDFVGAFKKRLIQFMAEIGGLFTATDGLSLTVQKVEFEKWARYDAEFVKKFPHSGHECIHRLLRRRIPVARSKRAGAKRHDRNEPRRGSRRPGIWNSIYSCICR